MQVSNVLGLHHPVAGLTAELDRLSEMVGLVGTESGNQQEQHTAYEEETQYPPVAGPGEVNPQRRQRTGRFEYLAMPQESTQHGQ